MAVAETVMLCDKGEWGQFPEGRLYEPKLDGARALVAKYYNEVNGIVEETGEEIDYEGIVCPNGCNLGMN